MVNWAGVAGALRDWAPAIANHLWQTTVFVGVAAALGFALRKNGARERYWVWMAASAKFVAPFALLAAAAGHFARPRVVVPADAGVYVAVQDVTEPFAVPAMLPQPIEHVDPPVRWWALALAGLWAAGFSTVLAVWVVRWGRVARLVRKATPMLEGCEADALRRIAAEAGLKRAVELRVSANAMEPGVFGVLRPVLLWPVGISERLSDLQLEAVLAHEVCHVRRRDNLTAVLHMLVQAVFWFHPLTWWVGARLIAERERACDEAVVAICPRAEVYAESILKVCEFCVESPLACVSGITGADLKRRVMDIMTARAVRRLTVGMKIAIAAAAMLAVAVPVVLGTTRILPIYGEIVKPSGPLPSFEAVTIKPSEPDTPGKGFRIEGRHFRTINTTLSDMLQFAYGLQARQVEGAPGWAGMEKYEISGVAAATGPEQPKWNLMMQKLLADRFGLQFHTGTTEMPVYELHVAKNGPKLSATPPNSERGGLYMGGNASGPGVTAHGNGQTMAGLAKLLGDWQFDRPVVDRTGLTGKFDFELTFMSDRQKGGAAAPSIEDEPNAPPSIFTAIQDQLGLKLEPAKGPVETLVIDHIQKPELDVAEVQGAARVMPVSLIQEGSTQAGRAATPLAFEVASIKPDTSGTGILEFENTPDGFQARGFTVQMLIRAAYGYDDALIMGAPGWLNSEHYTLDAKVAGSDVPALAKLNPEQRKLMLQPLLADRFQLKFHRETKQLATYSLVVAKGGLKLTPSPPGDSNGPQMRMKAGHLTCQHFSIPLLTQWLSLHAGRKVVDNSGLTGTYDFTLQWAPDSPASGVETADDGPSLFTAIQEQLGLKLEPAKGPVETFVIDDIEKPSEN